MRKKILCVVRDLFFWFGILIYIGSTLEQMVIGKYEFLKTSLDAIAFGLCVMWPFIVSAVAHYIQKD